MNALLNQRKEGNRFLNTSVLYSVLGLLFVFAVTMFFIHKSLLVITLTFYSFLIFSLLLNGRMGVILVALSFPLVRNSFAAITGNFHPILFYLVFLIGIVVIVYANIIGTKVKIPSLMMDKYLIIFAVYAFFSLYFLSTEREYGMEKFKYYMMNIVLFQITVLLVDKEEHLEQVFKAILFFSLFFTLFSLLSYLDLEPHYGNQLAGRFTSLSINPIWMARYFSYAIIIELYYIFKYIPEWNKHIGKITLLVVLILFQLYLLMLTGSRGPLFALFVGILGLVVLNLGKYIKLWHFAMVVLIGVIVVSIVISLIPEDLAERLLSQDRGGQTTTMIRLFLNIEALMMFWENKLTGIGFGGFNIIVYKYPHNIVTETLAELGAIGFVLLMTVFALAVKYLIAVKKHIRRIDCMLIVILLITSFVNANLSGHLGSNFFLFFSLGILYAARKTLKDNNSIVEKNGQ